jgi:glutathione-regulated potassium-efflux system ancillary protein KefF
MSKVLVISGHPELATSNTNQLILTQLESQLEQIEIRRLDSLYPDYQIDVEAEQQALLSADIVVLQYPFFWYAMPAILKKWLDDVFCYNFAYGSKGDKLKGKVLLASFTIGGPEEAYDPLGFNHFTIEQLMHPMQQTAYLSGMQYHKPIYSHGMVYIPGVYNTLEGVQAKAMTHAERLIDAIHRLRQTPSNARENQVKTLAQQWFAQWIPWLKTQRHFMLSLVVMCFLMCRKVNLRGVPVLMIGMRSCASILRRDVSIILSRWIGLRKKGSLTFILN